MSQNSTSTASTVANNNVNNNNINDNKQKNERTSSIRNRFFPTRRGIGKGKGKGKFQQVFSSLSSSFASPQAGQLIIEANENGDSGGGDTFNYALLIILYTLQGIPMGLSASIPFLLQERITKLSSLATTATTATTTTTTVNAAASSASSSSLAASYNANAIFALCSWPFSLKLLWAPIVDACYFKKFGRRKSWLVPVQMLAGLLLYGGANFVEEQLGLSPTTTTTTETTTTLNVKGVTIYFFILYFLMATQDIAVDGWALTMLSKRNRGKGPVCNSIGQNIGYFLSFVGFLAFNDIDASENIWRPLLKLKSNPNKGLISLKGFLKFMGCTMLVTTIGIAFWKRELPPPPSSSSSPLISSLPQQNSNNNNNNKKKKNTSKIRDKGIIDNDDDEEEEEGAELDAAVLGLKETYHRLWAVCQLPSVRLLFLVLVTYRLPCSLSDNVKFLKGVELGLSKSTTALLSPTVILPLGILVPIAAHHIWTGKDGSRGGPLQQFITAYKWRVTIIPILDVLMLQMIRRHHHHHGNHHVFWFAILASTTGQVRFGLFFNLYVFVFWSSQIVILTFSTVFFFLLK